MNIENKHEQRLVSHLEAREWDDRHIREFVRLVGHNACMSFQTALGVLEYAQAVDEMVEAEKEHDRVFGDYQPSLFEESEALEPGFLNERKAL